MRHGSLFSGVGGFDLVAEWMGWENIFHCEIEPFCQRVLKYYWPKAILYEDITQTDFTIHRGLDILTGGFPCQGFSAAGKRLGTDDSRYLWPEMLRAIRESKPLAVVGENVAGILTMGKYEVFAKVEGRRITRYENVDDYEAVYIRQTKMLVNGICEDLEKEGYDVQPFVIPAAGVNAPHRRDRVWFVAYAKCSSERQDGNSNKTSGRGITPVQEEDEGRQSKTVLDSGLCDLQGTPPDPKPHGDCQRPERIPQKSQGERMGQWDKIHKPCKSDNIRTPPDTNNSGAGEQLRVDGNRQEKDERRKGQSQPEPGAIGRDAPDTYRTTCQGELSSKQGQGESNRCNCENAAHTSNQGLQGRENNRDNEGEKRKGEHICNSPRFIRPNWDEFPTQSPLCGGDDGIPRSLDSITFSSWRNESIKAYGNAVVPQVVYQIFKAIDESKKL